MRSLHALVVAALLPLVLAPPAARGETICYRLDPPHVETGEECGGNPNSIVIVGGPAGLGLGVEFSSCSASLFVRTVAGGADVAVDACPGVLP